MHWLVIFDFQMTDLRHGFEESGSHCEICHSSNLSNVNLLILINLHQKSN